MGGATQTNSSNIPSIPQLFSQVKMATVPKSSMSLAERSTLSLRDAIDSAEMSDVLRDCVMTDWWLWLWWWCWVMWSAVMMVGMICSSKRRGALQRSHGGTTSTPLGPLGPLGESNSPFHSYLGEWIKIHCFLSFSYFLCHASKLGMEPSQFVSKIFFPFFPLLCLMVHILRPFPPSLFVVFPPVRVALAYVCENQQEYRKYCLWSPGSFWTSTAYGTKKGLERAGSEVWVMKRKNEWKKPMYPNCEGS